MLSSGWTSLVAEGLFRQVTKNTLACNLVFCIPQLTQCPESHAHMLQSFFCLSVVAFSPSSPSEAGSVGEEKCCTRCAR